MRVAPELVELVQRQNLVLILFVIGLPLPSHSALDDYVDLSVGVVALLPHVPFPVFVVETIDQFQEH